MAEIPPDVAVPQPGARGDFSVAQAARSIGLSLFINGICPYILYRTLEPHYPSGSLTPLLYASAFPLFGLVFNFIRTRTVDFIAVIALFEISFNILAASIAPSIHWALVARSLQGLLTATLFITTALIGRPIIYYIARQFVVGANPAIAAGFEMANKLDKGRTFFLITMAWGVGIIVQSCLSFALVLTLSPADYLLAGQALSIGFNVVLIAWTIRFSRTRLLRYRPDAQSA